MPPSVAYLERAIALSCAPEWTDVAISFNPTDTPLVPGGQIKFPIVAGAPPGGIVCSLPDSWTGRQRTLVFRLKLSKSGATANEVTINSVLYRQMTYATDDDDEHQSSRGADERGEDRRRRGAILGSAPPSRPPRLALVGPPAAQRRQTLSSTKTRN